MSPPGRKKQAADHALAQQLDLVRREEGLSTAQLAEALYCDPRSVRRYLTGERRPARDMVVKWEQVCGASPGRLTDIYDGSDDDRPTEDRSFRTDGHQDERVRPGGVGDGSPSHPSRSRRALPLAVAGAAVGLLLVLLGVFLFGGSKPAPTAKDAGWDHKDPLESGCSKTPEELGSVPVRDGTRQLGMLELRGSTACETAWGRVVLKQNQKPPITVEVVRPADGERDAFTYKKAGKIVFGNMLKHGDGCVYAEVFLGPRRRARTRSPCLQ